MLTVDNVLEWLVDIYGEPCNYEFHGIDAFEVMITNYPEMCEQCPGELLPKECWRKYLEAML